MSTIKCNQQFMNTYGTIPCVGEQATNFLLTDTQLNLLELKKDFINQNILINVYPSLDTNVCFESMMTFCKIAEDSNLKVLGVSMDTPFALKRISSKLNSDITLLSDIKNRHFGTNYGVTIADGPLAGFLARAVFLLDSSHTIRHVELVEDISQQPNYKLIIDLLKS